MRLKARSSIRITLLMLFMLSIVMAGCVKGTATHKVTVGQHTLREAVGAFQDVEIAEYNKGFVPQDVHLRIQALVKKVALVGVDLDNAAISGATATDLKTKFDTIYTLIDGLNTDGVLGVKNAKSKQVLEVALDSIRAIVDNILVGVK